MRTKILRWGNSLGVRIPKAFAVQANVDAGSLVEITVVDDGILIRRAQERSYDIDSLVEEITARNIHEGIETGPPQGKEVW